jgi:hypothetical protein
VQAILGALIAVALLGLYGYFIWLGHVIIGCAVHDAAGCINHLPSSFNDTMAQSLGIISGLVSALVVSELAITDPMDVPAASAFRRTNAAGVVLPAPTVLKVVSVIYLVAWTVLGFWAFLMGIEHPTVVPPVTSLGQAWIGLAVAAAYAYFGLKRQR